MLSRYSVILFIVSVGIFQGTNVNAQADFMNIIMAGVNRTMANMQGNLDNMMERINDLQETSVQQINEIIQKFSDQFQELIKKAEEINAAVGECAAPFQKSIDEARNMAETDIHTCTDTVKETMQQDINLVSEDIQKGIALANEVAENLSKCNAWDMICRTNAMKDLVDEGRSFANKASADGEEIMNDVQDAIQKQVSPCINNMITDINTKLKAALNEGMICIDEKTKEGDSGN